LIEAIRNPSVNTLTSALTRIDVDTFHSDPEE